MPIHIYICIYMSRYADKLDLYLDPDLDIDIDGDIHIHACRHILYR